MPPFIHHRLRWHCPLAKLTFWSFLFLALIPVMFLRSSQQQQHHDSSRRSLFSWGGPEWDKQVRTSAKIHALNGISVLVTGAVGFVGTHVSAALRKKGDGVLGLDNFNDYYEPSLKKSRHDLLERSGIFIVEGHINVEALLRKLFEIAKFTDVMHLAAQAGVTYAMKNPNSYVHRNIAGLFIEGRRKKEEEEIEE